MQVRELMTPDVQMLSPNDTIQNAARQMRDGDIGSLPDNIRRCLSRILKCYVGRKGYKEGGWGLLIALCAGLFPLLSHLKARLEPERHRG